MKTVMDHLPLANYIDVTRDEKTKDLGTVTRTGRKRRRRRGGEVKKKEEERTEGGRVKAMMMSKKRTEMKRRMKTVNTSRVSSGEGNQRRKKKKKRLRTGSVQTAPSRKGSEQVVERGIYEVSEMAVQIILTKKPFDLHCSRPLPRPRPRRNPIRIQNPWRKIFERTENSSKATSGTSSSSTPFSGQGGTCAR